MFYKFLLKKIFIIFILLFFIFSAFSIIYADEFNIEDLSTDFNFLQEITDVSSTSVEEKPTLYSKNIVVIDRLTNTILLEKNPHEKVPMASTTKILTCIIALENCSLNEIVTISKKASNIHGSRLGLNSNQKVSMESLLYGLMLRSGNDCAIAIAEHIAGSVDNFSKIMNQKAKSLGLKDSCFTSPHGLDDDNHYTTAYELALITNYALENTLFRKIVSTHNTSIFVENINMNIHNTNELLGNIDGVYGVKTGFTFNAGRCLASSCKRGNLDIIVVVLGADTKPLRTRDSISCINYIFNNYTLVDTKPNLISSFENYKKIFKNSVVVEKSNTVPIIDIKKQDNYYYPVLKKNSNNIHTKINCIQKLSFKTSINSQIGTISVYNDKNLLYSTNIYLINTLDKKTFFNYFEYILKNYFNLMYI